MNTTGDDAGRRRTTTLDDGRILVIDGRLVALGQAKPVTAKRVVNVIDQGNLPTTAVRRGIGLVGGVCVALTAVSVWFVPLTMLCAMCWLLCLYGEC